MSKSAHSNITLIRGLGLISAAAIVMGNVIGTGVFLKTRVMTCNVGTPGNAIIDNVMVNGFVFRGAPLATAAIPTLGEYALMALAGLLGLAGVLLIRR